jgi:colicin import membrane protein
MRYENSFRKIVISVVSFHLFCIGWCIWTGSVPTVKKVQEKLIVKTISLKNNTTVNPSKVVKQEPEPVTMTEHVPAVVAAPYVEPEPEPEVESLEEIEEPSPKPEVKKKTKPEPKKETKPIEAPKKKEVPPKKEVKKEKKTETKPEPKKEVSKTPPKKVQKDEKKVIAKPNPNPKPEVSKEDLKKQALIAKAQALLTKKGSSPKNSANDSKLANIGTIGKLEIDNYGSVSDVERRYQDILAAHLKDRLSFPDYGEVKIKLTLEKSGKVIKVEVISSKSDENRNYAVKILPGILFPSFDTFIKEQRYTFSVTLKND